MEIYIASDHAGFSLKGALLVSLQGNGYVVHDMGAFELVESDDYPHFITPCAEKVASMPGSFGIVIGGSGQGEAMAANRVKGVRAAVWYGKDREIIKLSREHNNANILSLGARFVSVDEAKEAALLFLQTPFSQDPRHVRRIAEY